MNMQKYIDLKNRYDYTLVNEHTGERVGFDGWDVLQRHMAFLELDAAIEEFCENGKDKWELNEGRDILDITTEQAEAILDRFIERTEEAFSRIGTEEMRNAIQDVTGLYC